MASIEETMKDHQCHVSDLFFEDCNRPRKSLLTRNRFFYRHAEQRSPEFCGMCRICTASIFDEPVRVSRLKKERLAISLSPQIKDLQEHIIIT